MPYEINLGDRTALVTGAARGIGRAISLELSNAGASIVVNDLSAQDCEGTVEEIKSKGGKAISFGADVSDKAQVEGMIAKAVEVFGSLDILVNNAGTVVRKSAIELSEEEWDKTIDVNLKGAFLCSQSAIRRMIESKRKGCNIINISSVLGDVALPPRSAYSASKGGMISLTKDLALEFAEQGIRANAVAPGWVRTEVREKYFSEKGVSEYLLERIPVRRFCEPEEIAALVVFLASDKADYITGQTIAIDGGWTAI